MRGAYSELRFNVLVRSPGLQPKTRLEPSTTLSSKAGLAKYILLLAGIHAFSQCLAVNGLDEQLEYSSSALGGRSVPG